MPWKHRFCALKPSVLLNSASILLTQASSFRQPDPVAHCHHEKAPRAFYPFTPGNGGTGVVSPSRTGVSAQELHQKQDQRPRHSRLDALSRRAVRDNNKNARELSEIESER
jgi:hypothetical protein